MSSRENIRTESTPMSTQMGEALVMRLVTVERELQEVQRKNSLLMIALGAALALALAGVALGLLSPGRGFDNLREIVLRDNNGVGRIVMRVSAEDGSSGLVIKDKNGSERIRLIVLENDAPGIALLDSHARNRVTLGFLENGAGSLTFTDEQGNTRAVLSVTANNSGALVFADANQENRAALGIDENGHPLWLFDQRGAASPTSEPPLTTGR